MKDPRRRDLMVQFYKLVEAFEIPSAGPDWWTRLKDATESFCAAWPDHPLHALSVELAVALWDALEAEYKSDANKPA